MKNALMYSLTLLLATCLLISSDTAKASSIQNVSISGTVTDNYQPVSNAGVAVSCEGHNLAGVTNSQGIYQFTFNSTECPSGSTVKITARKNGKSGVRNGTVYSTSTELNLAIVDVPIHEYGLVGALAAGGLSIGLVGYIRRQQYER